MQLVLILVTGRSIGDYVVRLSPSASTRIGGRLARWALGIGGYSVLITVNGIVAVLLPVLVVTTVISVFTTRGHRGIAYLAARWEVADDRSTSVRRVERVHRPAG